MSRIRPHFPRSHGKPRVDDRRVISGIIYVIRYGLEWKDAPSGYGPHKTLYNRFVRWSRQALLHGASRTLGTPDTRLPQAAAATGLWLRVRQ